VALVTGGGRRVGAAVARRLARAGYRVVVTFLGSREEASALAREVGGRALRLDLSRPASFAAFASRVGEEGRLDLLVHNAAVFPRTPLSGLDAPSFDLPFAVNLRAPVLLTLALRPLLAASRGRVVFVGDALAGRLYPSYLPYCLSKGALAGAARALGRDLAPEVAVSLVSPGLALPPEGFPPEAWEGLKRKAEGAHLNSPERVALAVLRAARRERKL
jgi:pteridine reductase